MARPHATLYMPFGGWLRFAFDFCLAALHRAIGRFYAPGYALPALASAELERVEYCCRLTANATTPFNSREARSLSGHALTERTRYRVDLFRVLGRLPARFRFHAQLGDVTRVPEVPSFVKSRPIHGDNHNAVLLPLNTRRHFVFVRDPIRFEHKQDGIVWRGAVYRDKRKEFLRAAAALPFCDVGTVADKDPALAPYRRPKLSIAEQLRYKFIFSIEGNDVATNLKWVLSSNSVCVMPPPEFETWFMEGRLQAGVHYVPIRHDFSDIADQYEYYRQRPELCLQIIANAQHYVQQFLDRERELRVARAVALRYAQRTGQV